MRKVCLAASVVTLVMSWGNLYAQNNNELEREWADSLEKKGVPQAQESAWPAKPLKPKEVSRNSYYFSFVGSYQWQGKRKIQTDSDGIYEFTEFKGASPFIVAGFQRRFTSSLSAIYGLTFRRTKLEGRGHVEGTNSEYEFRLTAQYLGAELGLRYHREKWRRWSFLGIVEVAREISAELDVLSGPPLTNNQIEKVSHVSFLLGTVYSRSLNHGWYFEPMGRIGAIASARPPIVLFEALLGFRHEL